MIFPQAEGEEVKMLKAKNVDAMAWCRDGSVAREATPCENLACKYKEEPEDVLVGILKCQTYQITLPRHEWASAYHLSNNLKYITKEKEEQKNK